MGVPIQEVGQMPWWAHRLAVEGLEAERPWFQKVVMIDGEQLPEAPVFGDDMHEGPTLSDLGVNMQGAGTFVGVKPEDVVR